MTTIDLTADLEALIAGTPPPCDSHVHDDRAVRADWLLRTRCPGCRDHAATHLCAGCLRLAEHVGMRCQECPRTAPLPDFLLALDGLR